ncbi:MAG: hypothetical protein QF385_10485, partial [SAR324 cluster bacterium]|nr:hypothetical protein [SAR324 cluster bacterium]
MIWKTDASIFLSGTTEPLGLKNTEGIMKKAEDGANEEEQDDDIVYLDGESPETTARDPTITLSESNP